MPPKKTKKSKKVKGKGKSKKSTNVSQVQSTRVSVRVAGGGGAVGFTTPMPYATYAPQMPYMPPPFVFDNGLPPAPDKVEPQRFT